MKNDIRPIHNRIRQTRIGADTVLNALAIGREVERASAVPNLAVAISRPIARAISLPLNHFTMILDTVIPAVSTPTPNIAKPTPAIRTCAFTCQNKTCHVWPSSIWVETAQYFIAVPITIIVAAIKPVKRTPILSRIKPPTISINRNTLNHPYALVKNPNSELFQCN